jgi:hypothetical protein
MATPLSGITNAAQNNAEFVILQKQKEIFSFFNFLQFEKIINPISPKPD